MPALFVADVKGFTTGIAHRIIAPRGEAELMGIFAPGVSHAAFGKDGSKLSICQHVHPGCRGYVCGRRCNHVLAPIGGEAAEPVVEEEIAGRSSRSGRREINAMHSRRREARQIQMRCAHFHQAAPIDLLSQRAALVADDHARDCLHQNAILIRYLFRPPHENSTGFIHHMRFDARGNQSHDLFLQQLAVSGAIFVPHHQVHDQSFQAPISVGLYQLAYQIDIRQVANLQQHDRQIARNRIAP